MRNPKKKINPKWYEQEPAFKEAFKPTIKRCKKPPVTTQRKALLNAYKQAYEKIPPYPRCPKCGVSLPKAAFERHHPAGRRKTSFLFTVQTCTPCHPWVHENGKDAESIGLLWPGRNSKVFTIDDAREIVLKMPFPAYYSIPILENFSLTK